MSLAHHYRIAAIVPCYNEEIAIAKVVRDLQAAVPGMAVFVYDNNSCDETAVRAAGAGAVVCHEPLKGKGNVVRRAFADIDADVYLLIDGDDTYDSGAAPRMIERLVNENLDHVVGVRREVEAASDTSAYRPAHASGNRALNRIVASIFGDSLGDMLSGYRVFSRRYVKSFPAVSREFEIETELTVHSLALRIPAATEFVDFRDRAPGSESKLRTYRDGWKILSVIHNLARHERPLAYFGALALFSMLIATALAIPVLNEYLATGYVPRVPTLVAVSVLVLMACLSMIVGMVLDGIRKSRHELSRLTYLRQAPVRGNRQPERPTPTPIEVRVPQTRADAV